VGLPQRRHSRWRLPVWGRPATAFGSSCMRIRWTLMKLTVPRTSHTEIHTWYGANWGLKYGRAEI